MKRDYSHGIIPLTKTEKGDWQVLLVQLHAGHWGFPKGHPNTGETPLEAAKRELWEETALEVVALLSETPLEETYFFKFQNNLIQKTVTYFLAEVKGFVVIMEEEVKAAQWVPLHEAENAISFDQGKKLCREVIKFLSE